MRAAWLKWGRRWWRVVPLAFAVLASSASAQVAGICGSGKNCVANTYRATTATASASTPAFNCNTSAAPAGMYCNTGSVVGISLNGTGTVLFGNASYSVYAIGSTFNTAAAIAQTGFGSGAAGGGTAYASFPTCNAGALGRFLFDSTNGLWRYCGSDSVWHPMPGNTDAATLYQSAQWASVCFGTCSGESTNFTGSYSPRADTEKAVTRINCSWGTAGTGGSTGVVVRLYDTGGAAELCSCTLGACTTAANTPLSCSCASGVLASSKTYAVQLKSTTDCTGNPSNIVCNTD
jgi:hypothetical protein